MTTWTVVAIVAGVALFVFFLVFVNATHPNTWAFGETARWRIVKVNPGYLDPYRIDRRIGFMWFRCQYSTYHGWGGYKTDHTFTTVEEARRAIMRWEDEELHPTPDVVTVETLG